MKNVLFVVITSYLFFSCNSDSAEPSLFTLKDESIGISFQNTLQYTEELNPYTYRNFYNGGGVAIGDLNNDGLADVFFTANMGSNKLYLNKGEWKFEAMVNSFNGGLQACLQVYS